MFVFKQFFLNLPNREFIEGGDLSCVLEEKKFFTVKEVQFIAACMVLALEFLHGKRNIKLSNILLRGNGYIVLSDFGLSTLISKETLPKETVGTVEYAAPEILNSSAIPLEDREGYTEKVDFWSLGIVLFELLRGEVPFKGKTDEDTKRMILSNKLLLPKKWKPELRSFIKALLEKDPKRRLHKTTQIKQHDFFKGFQWVKLEQGKKKAPFVPSKKKVKNLQYFNVRQSEISLHSKEILMKSIGYGSSPLTPVSEGSSDFQEQNEVGEEEEFDYYDENPEENLQGKRETIKQGIYQTIKKRKEKEGKKIKKKQTKLDQMKKKLEAMRKKEERRKQLEEAKMLEFEKKILDMQTQMKEENEAKEFAPVTKKLRILDFFRGREKEKDQGTLQMIKKLKKMSYFENLVDDYHKKTSSFLDDATFRLVTKNNYYVNLDGNVCCEQIDGKGGLVLLYRSFFGQKLFKNLFTKKDAVLPKLMAMYQRSGVSKKEIKKFVAKHKIDMEEFEMKVEQYPNFNNFFVRKLKEGSRKIDQRKGVVVSPADSKVYVIEDLSKVNMFFVKETKFDIKRFVKNDMFSKKFSDGSLFIFRLAPYDYHRFHFPCRGIVKKEVQYVRTVGNESVNPLVYKADLNPLIENERHIYILDSEEFGEVLVSAVGAMMIGKIIETFDVGKTYQKGDEMGYFEFGGSTIVLVFQKGVVNPLKKFVENSKFGLETQVRMGTAVNEIE